jgi:hypothetical protein
MIWHPEKGAVNNGPAPHGEMPHINWQTSASNRRNLCHLNEASLWDGTTWAAAPSSPGLPLFRDSLQIAIPIFRVPAGATRERGGGEMASFSQSPTPDGLAAAVERGQASNSSTAAFRLASAAR